MRCAKNTFAGNYVVGVHARTSNGEVLPPRTGNSNRFQGERNAIQTIFDIYKEKINHALFDSPSRIFKSLR